MAAVLPKAQDFDFEPVHCFSCFSFSRPH